MQINPAEEWQRLTAEYREKYDGELLELARDYADLTQSAQQALSAEMRSRGLGDPANPKSVAALQSPPTKPLGASLAPINAPSDLSDDSRFGNPFVGRAPALVPDTPETGDGDDGPLEYTWKTELCELVTSEEAMQLQEVLKRAGIECWFRFGGHTNSYVPSIAHSIMAGGIQVLVAADQLDQARALAANPIPQEIVDESKEEVPDYVPPKCPKCGAEDPTLESAEPTNHWHCENCDAEWDDPLPEEPGPVQSQ